MRAQRVFRWIQILLASFCAVAAGFSAIADSPMPARTTPPPAMPTPPPPVPVDGLAFDSVMKEVQAKPGADSADFFFSVTNISASNVVIDHVQTSCHCTVGKLPSQPWTLRPH